LQQWRPSLTVCVRVKPCNGTERALGE